MGNQITRIALPFQVYVLTQSTVAVGFLAAVQLVPILALSLGAGAVADAVDRRRLILVTSVGMAFCSLALAVLALGSPPSLPAIFGVAFLAASLASIDQPARSSAIPRLVPAERLPAAIALNQLNLQTASIVGPAVGGVIIAIAGLPAAYALDFVSFGAALAAIVGFGLATFSFPLALTLLALAGAADVLSAVFRSTIVQLETPDGLRGRVTAIHILVVTSGPRLGDIEAAAVAGLIGPQASVISGGLLCLLGVIGVARAFPQLDAHVAPPPLHGHAAGAAGGSGGPATGPE